MEQFAGQRVKAKHKHWASDSFARPMFISTNFSQTHRSMKRPNILLITTDQQRFDALRCNGNPDISTPNLDKLAAQGVNFDRFYVQNPVCMPSRVSFLTGQYPGTLGITHMGVPVPPDTVTLPRLLKNYGYTSANLGKLHFLPHANRDHRETHPDYGFDRLEISDEPGPYPDAYRAWVRAQAPDQMDAISPGLPPATEVWQRTMDARDGVVHPTEREPKAALAFGADANLTHSAFVADRAREFLREQTGAPSSSAPWLCVAAFYSPHAPWIAPQEFLDRYNPDTFALPKFPDGYPGKPSDDELRAVRHGYYAMVSEVDFYVGQILTELESLGSAENTVVVFTSDHGEWLGEFGKYGKGYPAEECVARVPCLVRWPCGNLEIGARVADLVEAVDIVPTLLDCAAIPIPPHLQGRSLLPQMRGVEAATRPSALTEMDSWKALHTPDYRYIAHADGRELLFDLNAPCGEYDDVAALPAHAPRLAEFRLELVKRLIERERPLSRVWPY